MTLPSRPGSRRSGGLREVAVALAWIAGLLAVVPLGMLTLWGAAVSPEQPDVRGDTLLLGGLTGLALGLGSAVAALTSGRRRGLWVALALVVLGVAAAAAAIASQPPLRE